MMLLQRRTDILDSLAQIEKDHKVKILYACESGSRAWGFASPDSDYDVRFIYVHRADWYLDIALERKRDVIEIPIRDDLDVSGWDLRKALGLMRKSNPPLLEWLRSPIVYWECVEAVLELRRLSEAFFSPVACGYHYLSMAKGNYRDYLQGPQVRLKKYLYVLRPILAVQWIEQELGPVPTEFQILVDTLVGDNFLKVQIEALLALKRRSLESDYGEAVPVLNQFIEDELERLELSKFARLQAVPDSTPLNQFFQAQVAGMWERDGDRTPAVRCDRFFCNDLRTQIQANPK